MKPVEIVLRGRGMRKNNEGGEPNNIYCKHISICHDISPRTAII
jgi:hypothetical protein